ncbi:MAG: MFS transporter [Spirochaetales bacterium]|nr:MFS transporter [Spirochaetales bacterium]
MKVGLFSQYKGLRKELYILFIGRIMTNMGAMIWPMFTLILNRKLGLNATVIAACMVIFSLVNLPVSLIGGKLADKLNKKNIIVVCDLVSIASFIYCAIVPVTITSIAIFAVASLFQTIEWPSYDALVADFSTSKDRERAYSLSYLGTNLGLVLSPTLAGFLFENHLNLAFLINGISIALSTILIFFRIRDVHRETDDSPASGYEADLDSKVSALSYIGHSRVVLLFIIAAALSNGVYSMYSYLMPLDMGITYAERGSVLFGSMSSTNCIVVVTCTALITRLFRKIRESGKMLIGEGLILAGYLLFLLFIRQPIMCFVAITVFTFGEIFNTLSSSPFLTRRIPASHRGRIIAVMNVVCGLSSSAIQLAVGWIYDKAGSPTAWTTVIGIGVAEILIVAVMAAFDRKDYPGLQSRNAQ